MSIRIAFTEDRRYKGVDNVIPHIINQGEEWRFLMHFDEELDEDTTTFSGSIASKEGEEFDFTFRNFTTDSDDETTTIEVYFLASVTRTMATDFLRKGAVFVNNVQYLEIPYIQVNQNLDSSTTSADVTTGSEYLNAPDYQLNLGVPSDDPSELTFIIRNEGVKGDTGDVDVDELVADQDFIDAIVADLDLTDYDTSVQSNTKNATVLQDAKDYSDGLDHTDTDTLAELTDTDIDSPATNEVLTYTSAGKWENVANTDLSGYVTTSTLTTDYDTSAEVNTKLDDYSTTTAIATTYLDQAEVEDEIRNHSTGGTISPDVLTLEHDALQFVSISEFDKDDITEVEYVSRGTNDPSNHITIKLDDSIAIPSALTGRRLAFYETGASGYVLGKFNSITHRSSENEYIITVYLELNSTITLQGGTDVAIASNTETAQYLTSGTPVLSPSIPDLFNNIDVLQAHSSTTGEVLTLDVTTDGMKANPAAIADVSGFDDAAQAALGMSESPSGTLNYVDEDGDTQTFTASGGLSESEVQAAIGLNESPSGTLNYVDDAGDDQTFTPATGGGLTAAQAQAALGMSESPSGTLNYVDELGADQTFTKTDVSGYTLTTGLAAVAQGALDISESPSGTLNYKDSSGDDQTFTPSDEDTDTLDELTDTAITAQLAEGDVLVYDDTNDKWINSPDYYNKNQADEEIRNHTSSLPDDIITLDHDTLDIVSQGDFEKADINFVQYVTYSSNPNHNHLVISLDASSVDRPSDTPNRRLVFSANNTSDFVTGSYSSVIYRTSGNQYILAVYIDLDEDGVPLVISGQTTSTDIRSNTVLGDISSLDNQASVTPPTLFDNIGIIQPHVDTDGSVLTLEITATDGYKAIPIPQDTFLTDYTKTASTTVSTISDTNISSIADNDVLSYDSATSKWINEQPSGGTDTLGGIGDVELDTETAGDVLTYDGSDWINNISIADPNAALLVGTSTRPYIVNVLDDGSGGVTEKQLAPAPITHRITGFDGTTAVRQGDHVEYESGGITTLYYKVANDAQPASATELASTSYIVTSGSLGDILDVDADSPSDNNILVYDSSSETWKPEANTGTTDLSAYSDTDEVVDLIALAIGADIPTDIITLSHDEYTLTDQTAFDIDDINAVQYITHTSGSQQDSIRLFLDDSIARPDALAHKRLVFNATGATNYIIGSFSTIAHSGSEYRIELFLEPSVTIQFEDVDGTTTIDSAATLTNGPVLVANANKTSTIPTLFNEIRVLTPHENSDGDVLLLEIDGVNFKARSTSAFRSQWLRTNGFLEILDADDSTDGFRAYNVEYPGESTDTKVYYKGGNWRSSKSEDNDNNIIVRLIRT